MLFSHSTSLQVTYKCSTVAMFSSCFCFHTTRCCITAVALLAYLVEENFSREYFSSQFGSEMHAGLLPKKIPQLDFPKKCFLKSHIYYSEKPIIGEISPAFY